MQKKYLLWIVVAVIIVVAILLFVTNSIEAPTVPVQPVSTNNSAIEAPVELDLEDSKLDAEEDIVDLDVSDEVSEDFDDEDFDDETIDDDAF